MGQAKNFTSLAMARSTLTTTTLFRTTVNGLKSIKTPTLIRSHLLEKR
jgi:hypothetical protein